MAPKKKKNVTNGFTMYMLEMQREISEQEGRRVPIPQLVEVANPQWKALSADQKAHYNNEAKRHKKGPKNGPLEGQGNKQGARSTDHRMDTTRNYISDRVSVADQLRERRENEKKLLTQNWPDGKGVCDRKFYFIAFQTLCKLPNDMGYLPCEVACAEYTLRNGIKRVYHRFLRPDPIPIGYRYTCKSNSENTPPIPIEGHEDATGIIRSLRELVAFINPDNHRVTPAVFCESAQRGMVEWSLKWLSERAGISNSLRKAIEVELLMTQLYAHVEEVSHSWSMLSGMLGDSKWDHMNDTRY
ncbi:hypothetical protein BSL78_06857 [Apostichopus japonicus]|uniref:HMG box domain-containing protein n=1 Tax=Stichopus japonicus TaxID=307972 RepID=A0A2G8L7G9_STIJA|nr:hypothetical protein BSL78_06857 [Apostichopus japonicus]